MYYLKTEASFDAAHFLWKYEGKCRNIHGHRWNVAVEIKSQVLKQEGQTRGMIVDFGDLKKDFIWKKFYFSPLRKILLIIFIKN